MLILAIQGCGKSPPPSGAEESLPQGHRFTARGRFLAVDLDHGLGAERAAVQRTWAGQNTLNTHFGPGWCDLNDVRLMHIAQDRVAVLRGGIGWRLARLEGEMFSGDRGEKVRKSADGWTLDTPNGQTLQFDSRGRLLSNKDPFGTVWKYAYDDKGRLCSVGDGPENLLTYHYDAARNRVISVDGPEGLRLEYQYDAEGRLVSVVNAWKVKVEYQYDKAGELVSARDQFSQRITLATLKPSPEPKPAAKAEPPKSPARPPLDVLLMLPQVDERTDTRGLLTERVVDGRKTEYKYDARGRVESAVSPEGQITLIYDRFGRPTAITGTDGGVVRAEYNNLDLPVRVVQPDGAERKLTYNEHGFLTREETSASDWTAYEYDAQGLVSVVRQAPSSEERFAYDERGRLARVAYSGGREVRYAYDAAGRRAAEEWSTGERRRWAYDDKGRLTESVSDTGLKTHYSYDEQGRIAEIEDPIHGKTTFHHTDSDLEWSFEKEGLGQTAYAMSPMQLPVAITSPSGQKTLFQYTPRGKLLAVITPSGQAWRYAYDSADRMTRILSPDGFGTVFSRDKAGRLVATIRAGVVWRQYAYDAQGRLAQESSPAGTAAAYEYDPAGRLKGMRLPQGPVTFQDDASGVRRLTQGPDYKIQEELHGDGSLARRVYEPAQLDLKLPQDKQGRPAGLELNGLKVTYGYGDKGSLERIVLPDGCAIRIWHDEAVRPVKLSIADAMDISIAYDRSDRITAVEAGRKGAASVLKERYAYDPAGNLVGIEETSGATRRLQYDAEDRMVKASAGQRELAFGYDVVGNLTSLASAKGALWWTFDTVGRPVRFGPLEYTWDAGGNLALTRSGDARAENTFDAASRLRRRTVGKSEWRFGYLPSGDRLWREGPAGKSWYAYLASGLVGFKDEKGVTWLIVRLPGTDWPLALCGSNGQTYIVAADRLHSVRRLVDSLGKVTASADYGPFGTPEAISGDPKLAEYAGMLVDASGLYYARQRYYDPDLARFISIDPIIGSPDDPASLHAYAYAANNPYRYRDPTGCATGWERALEMARKRPNGYYPEGIAGQPYLNPEELAELARLEGIARRYQAVIDSNEASIPMRQKAAEALERLRGRICAVANQAGARMTRAGFQVSLEGARSATGSVGAPLGEAGPGTARIQGAGGYLKGNTAKTAAEAAGREAAGEAAEAAGKEVVKAAGREAAGEAGKVAEGLGMKFLRYGGWMLDGLGIATDAYLAYDTVKVEGQAHYEVYQLNNADSEEWDAQKATKAMLDKMKEVLEKNKDKLLPRPDGSRWNPNNRDDMTFLINDVSINLGKGKHPLSGIMMVSDVVPNDQLDNWLSAVRETQRLLANACDLIGQINDAEAQASKFDAETQSKVIDAVTRAAANGPNYIAMLNAPGMADNVTAQTEAVKANLVKWGDIGKTVKEAATKASAALEAARGTTTAAADQAEALRDKAKSLIGEAEPPLGSAEQQMADLLSMAGQLRTSRSQLDGLVSKTSEKAAQTAKGMADIAGAKQTISGCLKEAESASWSATKARQPITGLLTQLRETVASAKARPKPWSLSG